MIARSIWRTANLYPGSAFGKIVRWPLWLVPRNTEIRVLAGPMRGFKWVSDSSNATCWMGVYESAKQQAFARIVKPGNVVFDLGANVGFYTLLASRLAGTAGRVFAFEPSARNVWYLRRHLRLNAIQNCQVVAAAVSIQEGIARFEASSLPVTGHLTNDISGAGYEVETVSLDGLLGAGLVPEPDVIKCDIEGGELQALLGARATLLKCKPIVLLATHGAELHSRCCDLLHELGYRLSSLEPSHDLRATDEVLAEPI